MHSGCLLLSLRLVGNRVGYREVCPLVVDHIFAVVQVKQVALLSVNNGFFVQLVAFALKPRLKLLLRVRTIYVPVNSLDFLLKKAVLLTGICAILNLLEDGLRLRRHKRAL